VTANQHLARLLEDMAAQKGARRMVRRLAGALQAAFLIADGDHLVLALGTGNEANNREALEHWVVDALRDLDEPTAKAVLPHLERRLASHLSRWEMATWY